MAKTGKINHYKKKDNIAGYLFLAPWIFGFLLMWLIPAVISIYYSFTDFNLLNTPSLIGLGNYQRIFTQDDTFWQALKVTFSYVLAFGSPASGLCPVCGDAAEPEAQRPGALPDLILCALDYRRKHCGFYCVETAFWQQGRGDVPAWPGGNPAEDLAFGESQDSPGSDRDHGGVAVRFFHADLSVSLKADSLFSV